MKDLVIVGGGPGGYVAAIRARQLGMTVTLLEKDKLGGTCLNRGCIPTKAYYRDAEIMRTFARSSEFSIDIEGLHFSLEKARERKGNIVHKLVSGIQKLLHDNSVEIVEGEAHLLDRNTVAINDSEIRAQNILIATGSLPSDILVEGCDQKGVINSDEILELTEVPGRLAIIGGGVIGLEFAGIFNAFGSEVDVFEYMPGILNGLDGELGKRLLLLLKKQKVSIHTRTSVQKIAEKDGRLHILAEGKKGEINCEADLVLIAGGRKAATNGLNLESLGIETDEKGFIVVDDNYESSCKGIYAIGDVIGGQMLAHVASEEGIAAVEKMAGIKGEVHYNAVPACIFTFPEIAAVGMSEDEAKQKGINYRTGKFQFAANGKAMTLGESDGMVKVIADQDDVILGVHIIGPHASDLILEGTLMVKNRMKISQVLGTIHPHPTLGEALMEAILDIKQQAIHLSPRKK